MDTQTAIRPAVDDMLHNLSHDERLWQEILGHDLSVVTKTFTERNPQYADQAEDLELECKRFMYLATVAPNLDIAPTKPIDEYWHQFVLFTEEYEAFCAKFNGYFVHHNPLAGPDHETIFRRTQDMVVKLFGEFKNRALWFLPMPATSCKCTNAAVRAAAAMA
jgi:hypothetical protein